MLDAGGGGSTSTDTDDDTTIGDGIAYNIPETDDSDNSGDLWESTETTGSTDYTSDVETDDSDDGASSGSYTSNDSTTDDGDSEIAYTGGVDTGLTRATGDGGGGDVAANDPVNPSASPDTTDREAMTQEADEQQDLIDRVQSDIDVQDTAENAADTAEERVGGFVDWLKNNPKKAAAAGAVVALAAGES